MVTIIYMSQGGSTKKYAEALSSKIGCECVSLQESGSVPEGSDVIFMGWRFGPNIIGYKEVPQKFNVIATVCVGLQKGNPKHMKMLMKRNKIDGMLFYLRGAMDRSKLDKKQIKVLSIVNVMYKLFHHSEEDKKVRNIMMNGGDLSSEDQLDPIVEWYSSLKN